MQLIIVSGRSGAGKSAYVRACIAKTHGARGKCILLVPDQSTFDAERALMRELGGGLIGVEVLTFARLAEHVLSAVGGKTRLFLSAEGKRMALRKLIGDQAHSLELYAKVSARSGFVQKLNDLIRSFKQAQITAEELEVAAHTVHDPRLAKKLSDIAVLYGALDRFMADKYMDGEDAQSLVIEKIAQAEFLRDTEIFIDSMNASLLNEQRFAVIRALLSNSAGVTITLRYDDGKHADSTLFAKEREAAERIKTMAKECGAPWQEISLKPGARVVPEAVKQIEARLFTYESAECDPKGLTIFAAAGRAQEVEQAMLRIAALLRKGERARDIAVACADVDAYAPLLRRAFAQCGFAYFMDEKRPLSSHPVVELCMASLQAAYTFAVQDILRAAKTGFSPLTYARSEVLEDYVRRFGIKYSGLRTPLEKGKEVDLALFEQAEQARQLILAPIERLSIAMNKEKTAQNYCAALFGYFEDIGLKQKLEDTCAQLEARGKLDLAQEYAQVWNTLLDILDQIAVLLSGKMDKLRFAAVLEEGFAAHEIGVIPSTTDQILVGDVMHLCDRDIGHLLVLGCNEGLIPITSCEEGIINDNDILLLREQSVDAFQMSTTTARHERQIVYALLARAQRSLFVSFALSDEQGKELCPSSVAERLMALFPGAMMALPKEDVLRSASERQAFSMLVRGLRTLCDSSSETPNLAQAYAYFCANDNWSEKLSRVCANLEHSGSIDPLAVRAVYNTNITSSVSRIETYYACPFLHFAKYGLKLQEPQVYEEKAVDRGNYYHKAFELFVKQVSDRGLDWVLLTQEQTFELLECILDDFEKEHNNGVLLDEQSELERSRMRQTAHSTVWAMVRQIAAGRFRPLLCEAGVGERDTDALPGINIPLSDGRNAILTGKIDRIDICEPEHFLRIIDYKSGDVRFSYTELKHGLKLQLPLYLDATNLRGKPVGMFYLHVSDPVLDTDEGETDTFEKYKFRGVLLLDDANISAMDQNIQMGSDVVPVTITKNGYSDRNCGYLLSASRMGMLMDYAREKAASAIEEILQGKADCAPARIASSYDACAYCAYVSVCRFEGKRGDEANSLNTVKAKEFFESVEGGENG